LIVTERHQLITIIVQSSTRAIDEINLNIVLFDKASEIGIDQQDLLRKYAFLLAITILHEFCHFKIRNFHGDKNLEKSPTKLLNRESSLKCWCFMAESVLKEKMMVTILK
jgi:hypothetical protein